MNFSPLTLDDDKKKWLDQPASLPGRKVRKWPARFASSPKSANARATVATLKWSTVGSRQQI